MGIEPTTATAIAVDGIAFKHYKLLVDDARALAERRDRVTSIFLSVVTLTLGGQGYLLVTFRDADVRSTIIICIAALFGTWLCLAWYRAIRSFKELLRFRYFMLKQWELEAFPEDERYYVAEDVLYHAHEKGQDKTPRLALEYVRQQRKIPFFSDTYRLLPTAAILAFWGIALIRAGFVIASIIASNPGLHFGA